MAGNEIASFFDHPLVPNWLKKDRLSPYDYETKHFYKKTKTNF